MFFTKKDKEKIMKGFTNLSEGFLELARIVDLDKQINHKNLMDLARVVNKTFGMIGKDMTRVEARLVLLETKKGRVSTVKKSTKKNAK